MVVAFLDLLGFTHLIQTDLVTARDNLAIFNEMLRTKFVDEKCHPVSTYSTSNGLREFVENTTITSFDYLISVSDSLIIGSHNPDLFVRQISNFIATVFIQYLEPFEEPFHDIKKVHSNMRGTTELSFDGYPQFTYNRAFPLLFRGGISFGSDTHFNKEGSVWDGQYQLSSVNVSGLSYVKAVQLEKSEPGPRLFCDQAFVNQIQDVGIKKGIRQLSEHLFEIIWTYFGCEATERSDNIDQNAFKRANRLFLPRAINLYNYFLIQCNGNPDDPSKKVVKHYKELILLICRGIYKYVYDNGGNTSLIADYMNQMLNSCGKDFSWAVTDDELQYFLM